MMRRPAAAHLVLGLVWACGATGCNNLDRFDTTGDGAYTGCIVGAPFAHEGMLPAGEPPLLEATLELNIDALFARSTNPPPSPGTLSTRAGQGLCAPEPLFADAPLRMMRALQHDPLSLLEFGDARTHNFMAWVDSTCQGTMLAVVSLVHDGSVELRLLKPAPAADAKASPEESPGFAYFQLDRGERTCNP